MRYILLIIALLLFSCSDSSNRSLNWQETSKTKNNSCYPNPDNKATYGVPQKWFC